jgi:hypothetical protein
MASKWRIALLLGSNVPVVPLPVVRYVSDGLIFELYDGGRPLRQLFTVNDCGPRFPSERKTREHKRETDLCQRA